jgi:drug/metabolite transporter (DMT)-like permease
MTSTPVSSMLLVLSGSVIGSLGAVFLKMGAERLKYGIRHLFNLKLATGSGLFLSSSVPYLMGIKHGELSVLFPMVSFGYVCGLFWSRLFFGEPFTKAKFVGLALILIGVIFVGLGKQ